MDLKLYTQHLIDWGKNHSPYGVDACDRWGDWLPPSSCHIQDETNCPVMPEMATFSYIRGLESMGRIAGALGNSTGCDCAETFHVLVVTLVTVHDTVCILPLASHHLRLLPLVFNFLFSKRHMLLFINDDVLLLTHTHTHTHTHTW